MTEVTNCCKADIKEEEHNLWFQEKAKLKVIPGL